MPDLEKVVAQLRKEQDAKEAEARKRHDELLAELRASQAEPERPSAAKRLAKGYADRPDPREVRRQRKGGGNDGE